jgi:RND family efflux transporter MFP subunit
MKTRTKWIAALVGMLVLSAGIGRAITARKTQQNDLAQSTASAQLGAVALSPLDVAVVSQQSLQRSLAVSGSLTAQRAAIVKAKVAAELLRLTVREGDAVTAGQVIGQLDPQEFGWRLKQAQQQAASAKAQWQIAQQNLENSQALVKQGFISRNALDTAVSNASSARANYEAAQSAAELAGKALRDCVVRSPIAGLVSQRFVQVGERVGVDARIIEVVDLSSLELQAPLSPADVLQVKVGTPATLKVEGLERPLEAKVARINPSAAADTRAVMVYLGLGDQTQRLRQGLFVQGRILLDVKEGLLVPVSAVVHDAGRDHVLVVPAIDSTQGDSGKVVKAQVQLGLRGTALDTGSGNASTDMVEVLTGLKAGDRVLSHGTGTAREGQLVRLGLVAQTAPVAPMTTTAPASAVAPVTPALN